MKSRLSLVQALGFYLLLGCSHISLARAHGEEESGQHGNMNMTMEENVEPGLPSYFSLSREVGLVYTHIALMTIAWVMVLPVAVMLSISASRYTFVTQIVFIAVNTLGILIAMSYNAQTPDLYPNNAHHKIGWIITAVIITHVVVGTIARRKSIQQTFTNQERALEQSFMPLATIPEDYADEAQEFRLSSDSNHRDKYESPRSMSGNSDTTQVELDDDEGLPKFGSGRRARYQGRFSAVVNFLENLRWSTSRTIWWCLSYAYKITDRVILIFGFVAFTTGIATFGRFFEGQAVFNGLAHWIKGGVFFWLGLFNLGRWTGSFADLGWAWNIRPRRSGRRIPPSAEAVESFLIFFYGSTNIFLEHLSSSDGKWRARDLEHISITVLFIGGGLCGMLVESKRARDLLNATVHFSTSADAYADHETKQLDAPETYGISLNPMPALVICLLGIMMSSHQQTSMTSSMVHKQWGDLLLGASLARCLTYLLMYIRPPTSVLPSRPPTELLASFGFIAGGIVFMASSNDTITGMDRNHLDAMFLYTVTMGLVGILMAWEVVVLAIKGLAVRKENSYSSRR